MPDLNEQIQCVRRELGYRRRVYPRQVAKHQISQLTADYQIECMEAVEQTILKK